MASSYVEITYFKPSESYKSGDVSLPLAKINTAEGLKKSYVGYQTEDLGTVLFWVNGIDWETKNARDTFSKREEILADSRPAFDSDPTVNYVQFENASEILGAPITEFVTFTLKEGNTMDQLKPLVEELHKKLRGTAKFHGDSWAPIVNKNNAFHGILGWDTVDAHWEAVSDGPLKEVIDRVKLVANLWLVHAELKAFSG